MSIPGVFNRKTLNDNWVEDRCHTEEGLSATGNYHKRCAREYETDLAFISDRYDVLSRTKRMPPRPSYAIPDDGFKETETTQKGDFRNPRAHPMFASKSASTPALINTANAPVCPPEKRELKGPNSGFGSAMDRHGKEEGQFFFATTHTDFYGSHPSPSVVGTLRRKEARRDPALHLSSGLGTEHEETKGSGMKCGKLCGENHCESSNPACDTRTQRSWMPGCDPGLTHIHHGGSRKQPPKEDNHLSLPLGDGAMAKIRADLKARDGRLFRAGTIITKGAAPRSGFAVFQDDA